MTSDSSRGGHGCDGSLAADPTRHAPPPPDAGDAHLDIVPLNLAGLLRFEEVVHRRHGWALDINLFESGLYRLVILLQVAALGRSRQ